MNEMKKKWNGRKMSRSEVISLYLPAWIDRNKTKDISHNIQSQRQNLKPGPPITKQECHKEITPFETTPWKTTMETRFEVLTVVWLRIQVFQDVMLCHWASGSWCFKGSWHLHLHALSSPRRIFKDKHDPLKCQKPLYNVTHHRIPQDLNP
jgi:hypothetical protein